MPLQKITRMAGAWRYVTRANREDDPSTQTTFVLVPLTQAERVAVQDDIARTVVGADGSAATVFRERQVALALCLSHVDDVQNFPPGAPEAWPEDRAARLAYLEGIDDDVIHEIGDEIFTRSLIGVAEKN